MSHRKFFFLMSAINALALLAYFFGLMWAVRHGLFSPKDPIPGLQLAIIMSTPVTIYVSVWFGVMAGGAFTAFRWLKNNVDEWLPQRRHHRKK
ncbi:MAG: hypothetical protein Q8R25_01455 [bacterium]|nr:hypothetical protein [bacterium]